MQLDDYKRDELFGGLLDQVEQRFTTEIRDTPVTDWAENILLDGNPFSLAEHEYQREILLCDAPRQVFLKGAQVGITSIAALKSIYGMLINKYPQGVLYLFPSRADVQDFSRGRMAPLLRDNEQIRRYVNDTDSQQIKQIGRSVLYLRGARSTSRIAGIKKTSSQLKSIPVDRIVFDEVDEQEPSMIDLALERLSHSRIKEEIYLSTPTIPDYGVDKIFQESDQRHWFIRCSKCNGETCLELEFPDCLEELPDGRVIRLCQRCRDNEIDPKDGKWVSLYPDRTPHTVGFRISQLNSLFIEPANILKLFRDPPGGNVSEVYNSKLAQAHIAAENRLTVPEVIRLCGDNPIAERDSGPCFMGVDVGRLLHCVISRRHPEKAGEIIYIGAFKEWEHLDTLMKRFNISRAVIDALPETRMSRAFAESHRGKVYLCYYQDHQKNGYRWNERDLTVVANRTEALDTSHNEIANGKIILPKESDVTQEFALECSNAARILQTEPDTGSSRYTYIKTGQDHYRHAQSYEAMARGFGTESIFGNSNLD